MAGKSGGTAVKRSDTFTPNTMAHLMAEILNKSAVTTLHAFSMSPELWALVPHTGRHIASGTEQAEFIREHAKKVESEREYALDVFAATVASAEPLINFIKHGRKINVSQEEIERTNAEVAGYEEEIREIESEMDRFKSENSSYSSDPRYKKMHHSYEDLKRALSSAAGRQNYNKFTDSKYFVKYCNQQKRKLFEENTIDLMNPDGTIKQVHISESSPVRKYLIDLYSMTIGAKNGDPIFMEKELYKYIQAYDVAKVGLDRLCVIAEAYPKLFRQHMEETARKTEIDNSRAGAVDAVKAKSKEQMAEEFTVGHTILTDAKWKKYNRDIEAGKSTDMPHFAFQLKGDPGIGKTAMLKQVAQMMQTTLHNFAMPHFRSTSFGLTIYDPITGRPRTEVPDDVWKLVTESGVILFDESTRTKDNPGVQNGLLKTINEYQIGGTPIHPLSIILCATNEKQRDDKDMQEEGYAFAGRIWHVDLTGENVLNDIIIPGWLAWVHEQYGDAFASSEANITRDIIAFLEDASKEGGMQYVLKLPEKLADNENIPTPRNWTTVLDAISNFELCDESFNDTALKSMLRLSVGRSATNAFMGYRDRIRHIPKLEELCAAASKIQNYIAWAAIESKLIKTPGEASIKIGGFTEGFFYRFNKLPDMPADKIKEQEESRIAFYKSLEEAKKKGNKEGKYVEYRKTVWESYEEEKKPLPKAFSQENFNATTAEKEVLAYAETLWRVNEKKYDIEDTGTIFILKNMLSSALINSIKTRFANGEPADLEHIQNLLKIASFFPIRSARDAIFREFHEAITLNPTPEIVEGLTKYGLVTGHTKEGVPLVRKLNITDEGKQVTAIFEMFPFFNAGRCVSDTIHSVYKDKRNKLVNLEVTIGN